MTGAILVLNIGSSTVKFAVYATDSGDVVLRGAVDQHLSPANTKVTRSGHTEKFHLPGHTPHDVTQALLDWLLAQGIDIRAVGHRVVHGGKHYAAPVLANDQVMTYLRTLIPLAPLHQPLNLAGIDAVAERAPHLPQVACFDTAFHRTQSEVATLFALPYALAEEGIVRYGFHGLSYDHIAHVLPAYTHRAKDRVIVAHLGAGASMCAMLNGESVASTMGFTALDGLPMATRTGALDPGVILHLMQEKGYDAAALEKLLYHESGLKGLSGISGDMRTLFAEGGPAAERAIDVYCYQAARWIGSLAAAIGGLDVLVFTAGVGEHSAPIRARICEQSAWLGVTLDASANERHGPRISTPDSQVDVLVVPTDEEVVIFDAARRLLA
jgi:acetate kinase